MLKNYDSMEIEAMCSLPNVDSILSELETEILWISLSFDQQIHILPIIDINSFEPICTIIFLCNING